PRRRPKAVRERRGLTRRAARSRRPGTRARYGPNAAHRGRSGRRRARAEPIRPRAAGRPKAARSRAGSDPSVRRAGRARGSRAPGYRLVHRAHGASADAAGSRVSRDAARSVRRLFLEEAKMKLPLQITFHGLSHSEPIADYASKRARKLDTFFERI